VKLAKRHPSSPPAPRVRVHPHGLDLGNGAPLPLWCGAMHYWHHSPSAWGAGLDAIARLGLKLVDTYVPWGIHELEAGVYDFGETDARLDVARFLSMAHERGLKVVLRPGPHINAELTWFGLPERIVWDPECQARTAGNHPVMLPMVPVGFPVPSYASAAFHAETERWFRAVAARVAHLRHPDGPIVMLQVDNEGALYFRDGPYDQDYHPDALAMFRAFLRAKYPHVRQLRPTWGEPQATFAKIDPPRRFDARSVDELARHMDWMEFHEHLLVRAFERMARALADAGLDGIPTMHNFPLGEAVTPLNAGRIVGVIDLVGLDYYHHATPAEHAIVMRRTTELASRCEGRARPAYGAEVGAGFPPFFAPLDAKDSLYTLMCALAYGLRGFNLYMAVGRDRWIGAPIDPHGRPRAFAADYEALCNALDRTRFHTLRRRAPVRLVVPRSLRRLARATHAFGPLTPAFFHISGAGFRESCLEIDLGLGAPVPTIAGETWLRAFERALGTRGVPFAYAGGETLDDSTVGAQWIIVASAGGMKRDLFGSLRALQESGAQITLGPRVPERDGSMRLMRAPHDVRGFELEPLDDLARADALVARRIEELSLPTYPVDPAEAFVCVHEDETGTPRVAFVMNPTSHDLVARVAFPGATALDDALRGGLIPRTTGAFEIPVPLRTARMLAIS
jgi:beta-galactosidase